MGTLYSAFRQEGFPTLYGSLKFPVLADLVVYGLIFCFCILAFSFYITVPGFRGSQRINVIIRFTVSILIGAFILTCNFGQEWEVSRIHTKTQYKAFSSEDINSDIGVKIGLRSVNITLSANGHGREIINYNEQFSWEWSQGRNGFGPQAGRIQREFRAAQRRGLPYPILWIAEYFTFDGEGIRFGRHYRLAGWYTHIAMWLAFPLWVLANILFSMVIRYGAAYTVLTGCTLLLANILYGSIRNFIPLEIPFEDATINMSYGWSFWLNLFTGLLCIVLGISLYCWELYDPNSISTFFGVDVLQDYEDFYADPLEIGGLKAAKQSTSQDSSSHTQEVLAGLKKRGTLPARLQRKSFRPTTAVPKRGERVPFSEATETLYANVDVRRFEPIGEEEEKRRSHENIVLVEMGKP